MNHEINVTQKLRYRLILEFLCLHSVEFAKLHALCAVMPVQLGALSAFVPCAPYVPYLC